MATLQVVSPIKSKGEWWLNSQRKTGNKKVAAEEEVVGGVTEGQGGQGKSGKIIII